MESTGTCQCRTDCQSPVSGRPGKTGEQLITAAEAKSGRRVLHILREHISRLDGAKVVCHAEGAIDHCFEVFVLSQ